MAKFIYPQNSRSRNANYSLRIRSLEHGSLTSCLALWRRATPEEKRGRARQGKRIAALPTHLRPLHVPFPMAVTAPITPGIHEGIEVSGWKMPAWMLQRRRRHGPRPPPSEEGLGERMDRASRSRYGAPCSSALIAQLPAAFTPPCSGPARLGPPSARSLSKTTCGGSASRIARRNWPATRTSWPRAG